MSTSRRLLRFFRVLLCAAALLGGGAVAEFAHPLEGRARAAAPRALAPLVVSSALPAAAPAVEQPTKLSSAGAQPAPQPPWTGMGESFRDGLTITGRTPHRFILFSFDDGPDRRNTPLLLDRLDAANVKALFFLTAARIRGRNLAERQQGAIAREIVRRGHLVASHTVDHVQLPLLDDQAALDQIIGTERIFEDVLGARPWLIRPPGGARSNRIDRLLARRGYTSVLWNLGTGDFQVRSAEEVFDTWKKVFERRERDHGDRGGIILMHDTYAWSVDAFQLIVSELERRNCELLERGEELYDIVDDPTLFYYPRDGARGELEAPPALPRTGVLQERQAHLREGVRERCSL